MVALLEGWHLTAIYNFSCNHLQIISRSSFRDKSMLMVACQDNIVAIAWTRNNVIIMLVDMVHGLLLLRCLVPASYLCANSILKITPTPRLITHMENFVTYFEVRRVQEVYVTLPRGSVVRNRYVVVDLLGQGGS